ncbi:hypothetical protein [Idiomarina aminovorans]|uniref:hypothetical protein n=1 Tax=Idiomarina aminovorans TaxID=2914829 RepID=UPI0020035C98|nr:hypothetical protein [Idiomarina sp. ATCH4]MCK7459140.1 hypothetical protein [Idiomarina sp. ATCH4]
MKRNLIKFLNDKSKYNDLYRKSLMTNLNKSGAKVSSLGVFESLGSALSFLSLNFKHHKIVSSNLKTNLFSLLFCFKPQVLIINGLGRYRTNQKFRLLLRMLLDNRSSGVQAIFQNYADYRFYRRFCNDARVYWVPGSGGVSRKIGASENSFVAIQRDSKLSLVAKSIQECTSLIQEVKAGDSLSFTLIGCSIENEVAKAQLPNFKNVGRYTQDDIFIDGGSFIQPEGYGEGIPHTLVDAICSSMKIFIKKQCFLRYGLHKLHCEFYCIGNGWGELRATAKTREKVSLESVNESYISIISRMGKF